jgi:hypothetical protein
MNRTIIIIAIAMTIIVIIAASPILRQIGGRAPEPCNICGKDSNTCPPDKCDGLKKITVTSVVTWKQAQSLAQSNGGRLPTGEEYKAAAVNAGSRDMWMPVSNAANEWIQIGTHAAPRYSLHTPMYGPPTWGIDNSNRHWRPRPNDPINYIYISINSDKLKKLTVTTVVTWAQANELALNNESRLATAAELKDSGINAGSRDLWIPVSNATNEWAQIGTHTVPRYSLHTPSFGPPKWGNDNSNHPYRPRPGDPFNYIFIVDN